MTTSSTRVETAAKIQREIEMVERWKREAIAAHAHLIIGELDELLETLQRELRSWSV